MLLTVQLDLLTRVLELFAQLSNLGTFLILGRTQYFIFYSQLLGHGKTTKLLPDSLRLLD